MSTIRDELVKAGVIRPARPGDPSAQAWRDAPTLRLDHAGAKSAKASIAKPVPAWKAERALLNGRPTVTPWEAERERAA